MSRERPILFSSPMIRALLDGSKTQTRRIVKLPHANSLGQWEPTVIGGERGGRTAAGASIPSQGAIWHARTGDCLASPYGQPSDHLWVRETFCQFPADAKDGNGAQTYYKAAQHDDQMREVERVMASNGVRWKPSIHMPRAASRILLEIVSVRVERLQDISEADAIAEGIEAMPCAVPDTRMWRNYMPSNGWTPSVAIPQNSFRSLWESINGEEGWMANPWVWCISFKRVLP